MGDGKSSRLYRELIEKCDNPHYYQIESCHYQFRDGDNFFIEANFDADKKDVVIDELKNHLKELEVINESELQKAKKRAKVNFVQESEMVADIADSIGYWVSVCDDISQANKYLKTLDEIDCDYLSEIAKNAIRENATIAQDQGEYQKRYDEVVKRYEDAKADYEATVKQIEEQTVKASMLTSFSRELRKQESVLEEFDEGLWGTLVDFMTVHSRKDIEVTFKDGTTIGIQ